MRCEIDADTDYLHSSQLSTKLKYHLQLKFSCSLIEISKLFNNT